MGGRTRYCDLFILRRVVRWEDVLESIHRHLLHDVEMNVLTPSGQWRRVYSYLRDSGGECTHTFRTVEGSVLIPSGQWRGVYSYLRDSGGECTHTFGTMEGNVLTFVTAEGNVLTPSGQ